MKTYLKDYITMLRVEKNLSPNSISAYKGDVIIHIPSDDTQRIQEGHLLAEHIMCEMVENAILN